MATGEAVGGRSGAQQDILIVDNDERIVELVAWFLAKRGYTTRSAESFGAARRHILERRPDLMLSDVDLGDESALEELPALEALGLLPPTLIVSGYLDPPTVQRLGHQRHVLGTLAKPFDFRDLELEIRRCLARRAEGAPGSRAEGEGAQARPDGGRDDGWVEITARPRASLQR